MTRFRHAALCALLTCWVCVPGSAGAQDPGAYRVGPDDTLAIRALVWDAVDEDLEEIPAVSGDYTIGADGSISVTLAGVIAVAGATTEEIGHLLEARIGENLPVSRAPRVSVSIERYAPVYVTGHVNDIGAQAFAPGLTVLKAITLAGGEARLRPVEGEERNFLSAQGAIDMLRAELAHLQMRRTRLLAELTGQTRLDAPDDPAATPAILAAEQALLDRRNARYDHEETSLLNAQAMLREALDVLEEKQQTNLRQLDLGRTEVQREADLASRGLMAVSKAFERVRYVSDLESRLLDIERSILLAHQELQDNERKLGLIDAKRAEDVSLDLQKTNAEIAEAEARIETQKRLMAQAAGATLEAAAEDEMILRYTIIRTTDGTPTTLEVDRTAPVRPGDVIEVVAVPAEPRPAN